MGQSDTIRRRVKNVQCTLSKTKNPGRTPHLLNKNTSYLKKFKLRYMQMSYLKEYSINSLKRTSRKKVLAYLTS